MLGAFVRHKGRQAGLGCKRRERKRDREFNVTLHYIVRGTVGWEIHEAQERIDLHIDADVGKKRTRIGAKAQSLPFCLARRGGYTDVGIPVFMVAVPVRHMQTPEEIIGPEVWQDASGPGWRQADFITRNAGFQEGIAKGKHQMLRLLQDAFDRVVGRRNEILFIVAALRADRHIFLEGPPGTSKSTILRAISESGGTWFCLVTGNSDLTTSKLIGYFDPAETLSKGYLPEHFHAGPLLKAMKEGMYLYVEEFNRLPDETTNVFVTVTSENKLSVPRLGIVEAHRDFRIVAALNPLDDIGISRISRALKDRFCSFKMDDQSRDEEIEIVKRTTGEKAEEVIELAVDMARRTRTHPDLKLGASVRASIDTVGIYREVSRIVHDAETEDVEQLSEKLLLNSSMMAFRNRIWIYETSEKTPEQIIEEIFYGLRGPKKKPSK